MASFYVPSDSDSDEEERIPTQTIRPADDDDAEHKKSFYGMQDSDEDDESTESPIDDDDYEEPTQGGGMRMDMCTNMYADMIRTRAWAHMQTWVNAYVQTCVRARGYVFDV